MDPVYHYLNARGFKPEAQTNLNAVYEDALPRFLDLFDEYEVKATFFVVGRDAEDPENRKRIQEIVKRGHEVANHTFSHLQHFRYLTEEEKEYEIKEADKILSDITGSKINGFRAPGWGIGSDIMNLLESMDYTYDSSVFPSLLLTPISYINWILNKGRLKRSLGGSLNIGLAPKLPYRPSEGKVWKKGEMGIVELPPSVLPILQFPFLGTVLFLLGKRFFYVSNKYFSLFRRPLLYELHGIELVDYYATVNDERLKVKPGMGKEIEEKESIYRYMLSNFQSEYAFITMKELSEAFHENSCLSQ
jgi:hypothetical protein